MIGTLLVAIRIASPIEHSFALVASITTTDGTDEARFAFEEFIQNRTHSPRLAAAYIYLAAINEKHNEKSHRQFIFTKGQKTLLLRATLCKWNHS